jgi:hypothetical protein
MANLKPEADSWWQKTVEKFGWKKAIPTTEPDPAPPPQERKEEVRPSVATRRSAPTPAPTRPPAPYFPPPPKGKIFRVEQDFSVPPRPPGPPRKGGSSGDGSGSGSNNSSNSINPDTGGRTTTMATTTQVANSAHDIAMKRIMIGFALAVASAVVVLGFSAWNNVQRQKFDNTPAGMAVIAINQTRADAKLAEAEAEKLTAARGTSASPATVAVPTVPATQSAPALSTATPSTAQTITLAPCGGEIKILQVGPNDKITASGNGCFAMKLVGPVTFNGGSLFNMMREGDEMNRTGDVFGNTLSENQAWLSKRVGEVIIIAVGEIGQTEKTPGEVRFNQP